MRMEKGEKIVTIFEKYRPYLKSNGKEHYRTYIYIYKLQHVNHVMTQQYYIYMLIVIYENNSAQNVANTINFTAFQIQKDDEKCRICSGNYAAQ